MTIRVRFLIKWIFPRSETAALATNEAAEAHAADLMLTSFMYHNPEMTFTVVHEEPGLGTMCTLTWDVDLDDAPGSFDDPKYHVGAIEAHLDTVSYVNSAEVTVLRHVPLDSPEVRDHLHVLMEYRNAGQEPETEDYPVFIPDPEAGWPEANQVFLQDECWHWEQQHPETGKTISGPSVGPVPRHIFTPWTETARDDIHHAAVSKQDRLNNNIRH